MTHVFTQTHFGLFAVGTGSEHRHHQQYHHHAALQPARRENEQPTGKLEIPWDGREGGQLGSCLIALGQPQVLVLPRGFCQVDFKAWRGGGAEVVGKRAKGGGGA
eukprot:SAG31_NODE_29385_length_396_cov_0.787879_1_plen_104_part_01